GQFPELACAPGLSCCIPAGGGRDFDLTKPFEQQLASMNCTRPVAWARHYDAAKPESSEYWFLTTCSTTFGTPTTQGPLSNLVMPNHWHVPQGYADVDPYWARFPKTTGNSCLPPAPLGRINVTFDPDCPSGCMLVAQ